MIRHWIVPLGICLTLISTLAVGCGRSASGGGGKHIPHVRTITTLYFTATSALGGPPKDEQQFKAEINKTKPDLDILDVGSIDELFISDRDGQPLVILYGPKPQGVAQGVIAYERTGADGVRLVGTNNGQVIEADPTKFAELVQAPQQ